MAKSVKQRYIVSMPLGDRIANFEATNVKEVEGGFFATVQNSAGGSNRDFYSYNDGAFFEEE